MAHVPMGRMGGFDIEEDGLVRQMIEGAAVEMARINHESDLMYAAKHYRDDAARVVLAALGLTFND